MSDNELSIQMQSNENDVKVEEPQLEQKSQNTWVKSSKDLIDKYKNKFDAFKAMADQAGYVEQNKFLVGNEARTEIFKKMDVDGDDKISQEEWNQGWKNLDIQYDDTQHKVSIAQQKQEILDVLDIKNESQQKFFDSSQKFFEQIPTIQTNEQVGTINTLLGQFKSASTLDDLTDLFNKRSPFKERSNEEQKKINYEIDYKPQKIQNIQQIEKNQENLLQQFRTPNKIDYDSLFENAGSNKQVGTYLNPPVQNTKPQMSRSPNARFGFISASPSSQYVSSSKKKENQQNTYLNTKVQQSMNFSVEVKDQQKCSKRKDELYSFMGKLGIGKYEAPKVTINLDSANGQYSFEKLKHYVNNIGNSGTKKAPSQGLGELVNDKSFNTCTFKQQVKAHKKLNERGESAQKQSDIPMLHEQSLKNLQFKVLNISRASSQVGRQMRI